MRTKDYYYAAIIEFIDELDEEVGALENLADFYMKSGNPTKAQQMIVLAHRNKQMAEKLLEILTT